MHYVVTISNGNIPGTSFDFVIIANHMLLWVVDEYIH